MNCICLFFLPEQVLKRLAALLQIVDALHCLKQNSCHKVKSFSMKSNLYEFFFGLLMLKFDVYNVQVCDGCLPGSLFDIKAKEMKLQL